MIADKLKIHTGTVSNILTEDPNTKKVGVNMLPKNLSSRQKNEEFNKLMHFCKTNGRTQPFANLCLGMKFWSPHTV
jgi:hypothetical protein